MIIRMFGSLGDEIALTGLVREYRKQYPDETLIVTNKFPEIFTNNPHLGIRKNNNHKEVYIPTSPFLNIGNYTYAYGKYLGIKIYDSSPEIFLSNEELEMFPGNQNIIAIDTWAGWPSRRWDFNNFVELVERIKEYDPKVQIVEVGKTVPDCTGQVRNKRLLDAHIIYLDVLSLRQTAALLRSCKLFIGNDSGLSHLAAAVGTNQITIYSVPWYDRSYRTTYPVFNLKRNCEKCESICPKGTSCINEITPSDIIEVLKTVED